MECDRGRVLGDVGGGDVSVEDEVVVGAGVVGREGCREWPGIIALELDCTSDCSSAVEAYFLDGLHDLW